MDWHIPTSTLYWLENVPVDRPVALLLRHSVRGHLPLDGSGCDVPLISVGVTLAIEFGKQLGLRLKCLHTSPLVRCVQTAEGLREGSGVEIDICLDRQLGDPGVFVIDPEQGKELWQTHGHEEMMLFLINGDYALAGMANPVSAAYSLVQHILDRAGNEVGIHVFVTHDSLVAATALRLLKRKVTHYESPEYLEGAFFWRENNDVYVAYREQRVVVSDFSVLRLSE